MPIGKSIDDEGRQHVRKRPGIYIGGTDIIPLHHFAYEILDSSIEEAMMGRCSQIEIELHPNQTLVIQDNSQGLPIGWDKALNISFIELLFTHTGAFKNRLLDHYSYTISVGLYGVGFACINPLCELLRVSVKQDGYLWEQTYHQGIPQTDLLKTPLPDFDQQTGTRITLQPDFTIMQQNDFSYDILRKRCQELAYLTPSLTLTLSDFRLEVARKESFYAPHGLISWLQTMSINSISLFDPIHGQATVEVHPKDQPAHPIEVAFAFQFTDASEPQLLSYINSVKTPEGGTHIQALQKALTDRLNAHLKDYLPVPLTWWQLQRGLCAVISIWHPNPQFESPIKIKLMNPEILNATAGVIKTQIDATFSQFTSAELDRWANHFRAI